MALFIIVYLLGYIFTFIMTWRYALKRDNEISLSDLIFSILISLGSWLSFIIGLTVFYGDVVIYKPKNNELK